MRRLWLLVSWLTLTGCGPSLSSVIVSTGEKGGESARHNPFLADGFTALGQRDGVTVYRREVLPGIELGAEGDIPAPPDRVLRVLVDYPNHSKWQEHLAECKVLSKGEGSLDVYQRLTLPVLDDRDFILHVTWESDPAGAKMHFAVAPGIGPEPIDGVVRVTSHEGGWVLTPIDGGKATHAQYRFHLDLAGDFPSWMGKGQAADDLVDFFAKVRAQLPNYP